MNFVSAVTNCSPPAHVLLDSCCPIVVVSDNSSDYVFVDDVDLKNFPKFSDVKVHNHFKSKSSLVKIMHKIVIRNNFQFNVDRSSKTRLYFICVNDGCSWDLKVAVVSKDSNFWHAISYKNSPSCIKDIRTNNHR